MREARPPRCGPLNPIAERNRLCDGRVNENFSIGELKELSMSAGLVENVGQGVAC